MYRNICLTVAHHLSGTLGTQMLVWLFLFWLRVNTFDRVKNVVFLFCTVLSLCFSNADPWFFTPKTVSKVVIKRRSNCCTDRYGPNVCFSLLDSRLGTRFIQLFFIYFTTPIKATLNWQRNVRLTSMANHFWSGVLWLFLFQVFQTLNM